jgi:hypothetical protein
MIIILLSTIFLFLPAFRLRREMSSGGAKGAGITDDGRRERRNPRGVEAGGEIAWWTANDGDGRWMDGWMDGK